MKKSIVIFILYMVAIFLVTRLIPEETLHAFIDSMGTFGPLVYILLTLVAFTIAPLSATPLLYAGYFAFGQVVILYSTIATVISFVVNFVIARRWGREFIRTLVGQRTLHRIDTLASDYGLLTLFFMRALQGGVHEVVSYAAGLTQLSFQSYFLVSLMGLIPGTLIWFFVSTRVGDPFSFTVVSSIVSTVLSASFVGAVFVYNRIQKRRR